VFFAGIALLPPLIMLWRVLMDRRIRFLVVCALVLMAGMVIEIFLFPHYLAPFTSVLYAIGLQTMRHLRVWNPSGQPVGLGIVRLTMALCVALAILRVWAEPVHLSLGKQPASAWCGYGSSGLGAPRARIQAELEQLRGKQLAIVRYSPEHDYSRIEWVYNAADIDSSKVIWAREMDAPDNEELIRYYKDRKIWLVQPDERPALVTPYPSSGQK
jgi:hypothetical protein